MNLKEKGQQVVDFLLNRKQVIVCLNVEVRLIENNENMEKFVKIIHIHLVSAPLLI